MKAEDLVRFGRTERMMVRRMCGVSSKDRKRGDEFLSHLGIECVEHKIRRVRLNRSASRKTWRSCVKRDMKAMGIKEEMAQDRCA